MLITQVQMSKLADVTTATIASNVTKGILIKDPSGKMDPENKKNAVYLQKRMKAKSDRAKKDSKSKKPKTEYEKEIADFTDLATREQELKVQKLQADVRLKDLLWKDKRGDLVSKQKLGDVCFSYLDTLNKNLLVVPQVFLERVENFIKYKSEDKDAKKVMMNEITGYMTKAIINTKKQITSKMKSKHIAEDTDE